MCVVRQPIERRRGQQQPLRQIWPFGERAIRGVDQGGAFLALIDSPRRSGGCALPSLESRQASPCSWSILSRTRRTALRPARDGRTLKRSPGGGGARFDAVMRLRITRTGTSALSETAESLSCVVGFHHLIARANGNRHDTSGAVVPASKLAYGATIRDRGTGEHVTWAEDGEVKSGGRVEARRSCASVCDTQECSLYALLARGLPSSHINDMAAYSMISRGSIQSTPARRSPPGERACAVRAALSTSPARRASSSKTQGLVWHLRTQTIRE
jgi:hypothetical protein